MERERLTRLVEDPEIAGRADVAALNDLAERFPWFASAQVLRSVVEHRAGEVLSEEVLRNAAAHVPSRTILFDRVNTTPPAPTLTVVPKEITTPEPLLDVTVPPSAILPAPVQQEAIKAKEAVEAPTPVSIIDPPEQSKPEGIEEAILPPDPLDVLIQQAAKLGSYDIDRLGEPIPATEEEPDRLVPEPTPSVEPEPEPVVVEQPSSPVFVQPLDTRSKRSFTDWLSQAPEPIAVAPPKTGSAPPTSVSDWQRGPVEPIEDLPTLAASPRKRPQEPSETMDLIDRFIRQQEPPPLPKVEFYTPQQAGKRSLDDSTGMVTETLAKVYVKQGNLPKAIEAYHKLALKYPEKSAFFAALAKELEVQQHK